MRGEPPVDLEDLAWIRMESPGRWPWSPPRVQGVTGPVIGLRQWPELTSDDEVWLRQHWALTQL